jgi:uncharacterized membrane protein
MPAIGPVVAQGLPRVRPADFRGLGAVGTPIGAGLLNLDAVRGLGAPVASIGGAGTFDGIFHWHRGGAARGLSRWA